MDKLDMLKEKLQQYDKWANNSPFVNLIHKAKHRTNSFSFVVSAANIMDSKESIDLFFKNLEKYAIMEYGFIKGKIKIHSQPFGWDPLLHTVTVSRTDLEENIFLGETTYFPLHERYNEARENVMKNYTN